MLRHLVTKGTKQATVTLFDATKKIIGYPIIEFITSNKEVCMSLFKKEL